LLYATIHLFKGCALSRLRFAFMQISEPVTMLTDFALSAASLCFAILLARIVGPRNRVSAWLWCAAFIASSVAALPGGIYHGFTLQFDTSTLRVIWGVLVYAI